MLYRFHQMFIQITEIFLEDHICNPAVSSVLTEGSFTNSD